MFVKIFDESHEADLEDSVNEFINTNDIDIIDIKYQVSTMYDYKNQKSIFVKPDFNFIKDNTKNN